MKSRWNSLVAGGCNVIGLTLLALSATASGSAVRAAGDSPALESMAIEPLTKVVSRLEHRAAAIEASVAAFANSIAATRIAARELCVADGSGAQTCITKAQLDALLKGTMQTAQAAQTTQSPEPQTHASEQGACPEKCVAPAGTLATDAPLETPRSAKETAAPEAASAAAAARETPSPEAAAAVSPAPPASSDRPQAAESTAPVPADKPVETVIATTTKPEPLAPAEPPAKEEVPAQADPATSGSAVPELNAVPSPALPRTERK